MLKGERSFQGCQMQTKPQNVAFNCNYWIVLQLQPKSKSLTHTQYPSSTRLLLLLLLLLVPCPVRSPSRSRPRCWYNNCNRILFVKPNWFIFLLHSSGTLSPHVAGGERGGRGRTLSPLQGIARQHVNRSIYAE